MPYSVRAGPKLHKQPQKKQIKQERHLNEINVKTEVQMCTKNHQKVEKLYKNIPLGLWVAPGYANFLKSELLTSRTVRTMYFALFVIVC